MKKRKIALTIISIFLVVCLILSFSYAIYIISPTNSHNIAVTANIPQCAGITLNNDTKITLTGDNTAPVSDAKALSSNNYRYSFTVTNGCSSAATMKVALAPTTTSTMSPRAIKYAIYESTGSQPSTGSFLSDNGKTLSSDIANEVNSVTGDTVVQGYEILSTTLNTNTSKTYYVYVWVDKDEGGLGNNVTMNSTFYGHLVISDYQSLGEDYFVAAAISSEIREVSEQTSSQTNGGVYGVVDENNALRYEGKDPNNYVCFSDTCTDNELYRIMGKYTEMVDTDNDGVADTNQNVIKIIKYTSIGGMNWDSNWGNTWSTASLKTYLNDTWTKPTNDMLTTRWRVGENSSYTNNLETVLSSEATTTWDGKVGLMSLSDYAYAAYSESCPRSSRVCDYNSSFCKESNWLYLGADEWTMTPSVSGTSQAFEIHSTGYATSDVGAYNTYAVRPAFYISSTNYIVRDGNGSKTNPYIVKAKTLSEYINEEQPAGYRGSSHTDSATQNLYRYTGTYQSTDAGYAGTVDNYICLGTNASTCPDNNMYRIIGVVAEDDSDTGLEAGMIKVIKNTSIGTYKWDGGTSKTDTNSVVNTNTYGSWVYSQPDWKNSILNTSVLNNSYINNLPFKNNIASVKWHCHKGGDYYNPNTPTASGEYESSLCDTTSSKISLMYAGDYLDSYDNGITSASSSNRGWLNFGTTEWTMANGFAWHGSLASDYWEAWTVYNNGNLSHNYFFSVSRGSDVPSTNAYTYAARPVFYLNKDVSYSSGTGTYSDPLRLNSNFVTFTIHSTSSYYNTVNDDTYVVAPGTTWSEWLASSVGLSYLGTTIREVDSACDNTTRILVTTTGGRGFQIMVNDFNSEIQSQTYNAEEVRDWSMC